MTVTLVYIYQIYGSSSSVKSMSMLSKEVLPVTTDWPKIGSDKSQRPLAAVVPAYFRLPISTACLKAQWKLLPIINLRYTGSLGLPIFPSIKMESVLSEDHEYTLPRRAVISHVDMEIWSKSEAYFEYCGFISSLNDCIKGKPLTVDCVVSDATQGVLDLLNTLDKLIDSTPPIEQPQRFGNKAFRLWLSQLQEKSMQLVQEALPERFHRAAPEIMVYLNESFGNATRIDYGTGHEMAFVMFLCCLFKIGAVGEGDKVAVVTKLFNSYLTLVRKLQLTYRMEPAGSHGVWSLDDYQFIPFIWGSSQLIGHQHIEPRAFLQPDTVSQYKKEYMFLGCIDFINQVKTGMFAEHSNQLWNISAVPTWAKINAGLIKMYKNEVLSKFPVIQHVLFGSILQYKVAEQPLVHRDRFGKPSARTSDDIAK